MEFLIKQQEEKDFKNMLQTDAQIFNSNPKAKTARNIQEVDEAIVIESQN